jgi:hypothetical protein
MTIITVGRYSQFTDMFPATKSLKAIDVLSRMKQVVVAMHIETP